MDLAEVEGVTAQRSSEVGAVDRWHPETHTFHLPCGEMSVTLQDTAMILGLPINGPPVTGILEPGVWRAEVAAALGVEPTADPNDRSK